MEIVIAKGNKKRFVKAPFALYLNLNDLKHLHNIITEQLKQLGGGSQWFIVNEQFAKLLEITNKTDGEAPSKWEE